MAGGGIGGTNRDLTGGATGLPVVVGAILYVANDALDMGAALLVVHFRTILLLIPDSEDLRDFRGSAY